MPVRHDRVGDGARQNQVPAARRKLEAVSDVVLPPRRRRRVARRAGPCVDVCSGVGGAGSYGRKFAGGFAARIVFRVPLCRVGGFRRQRRVAGSDRGSDDGRGSHSPDLQGCQRQAAAAVAARRVVAVQLNRPLQGSEAGRAMMVVVVSVAAVVAVVAVAVLVLVLVMVMVRALGGARHDGVFATAAAVRRLCPGVHGDFGFVVFLLFRSGTSAESPAAELSARKEKGVRASQQQ